eukprot:Gregarina_sp_Poly_1__1502@NODE_1378_length_4263_cov_20_659676_g922_i0_p2_GENE_NODE_1378_length_4263_cov_20_659676_g922_i0NODE_1378_length_4263_cov_20_659676_g922_i0_p2_ORF_typecomplete_len339_score33_77ANAPC10/PF03256_16/1_3e41_NODE_1378_length_4263_cov_20_659676_g922_i032084224
MMETQMESLHIPESLLEDVTQQAVWHVSSAKAGTGVADLIDGREDTFWQSDHLSPHCITATFPRKLRIARIDLFINYHLDDTYTPKILAIRLGFNKESLMTVGEHQLHHPIGWQRFEISPAEFFKKAFPGFHYVQRLFRSRLRLQREFSGSSASRNRVPGPIVRSNLALPTPSSDTSSPRNSVPLTVSVDISDGEVGSPAKVTVELTEGLLSQPLSPAPRHRRVPAETFRESVGSSSSDQQSVTRTGFAQDIHRNTLARIRAQPTTLLNVMAFYWAEATRALCNETDGIVLDKKTYDDMARWYFPAFVVQVVISQNYQNGQDSHVRQIRVWAFRESKP